MTVLLIQYLTLLQYTVEALVLLSELAARCGFPFNAIVGELDFRNKSNKYSPTQKHQSHTVKCGFIIKSKHGQKAANITVRERKIGFPTTVLNILNILTLWQSEFSLNFSTPIFQM